MIYDLIGVGFGPAAISLAINIDEFSKSNKIDFTDKVLFLERHSGSSWHNDFLLPGTSINHHFLTDLVTPRNPKSDFTFVNFLHEKNKLYPFCYLDNLVSRAEWNEYIIWAANKLSKYVNYNSAVTNISITDEGYKVEISGHSYYCRNVLLSSGLAPNIPFLFRKHVSHPRVIHSGCFLSKINALTDMAKKKMEKFLVIGSGQSAIEACMYLNNRFLDATVYSSHRTVGFKLKDTGHTSNEIYFPKETDYFYQLPECAKDQAFEDTKSADYGNVSKHTSYSFAWKRYEDVILHGQSNIEMLNRLRPRIIETKVNSMLITLEDVYTHDEVLLDLDAVVLCTGYQQEPIPYLLDSIREHVLTDSKGRLLLNRDYSIKSKKLTGKIYLSGMSESTHGISDTQSFSIMAKKSEKLFSSMMQSVFLEEKMYDK